jgi:hypothetical protein
LRWILVEMKTGNGRERFAKSEKGSLARFYAIITMSGTLASHASFPNSSNECPIFDTFLCSPQNAKHPNATLRYLNAKMSITHNNRTSNSFSSIWLSKRRCPKNASSFLISQSSFINSPPALLASLSILLRMSGRSRTSPQST